MDAKEKICRRVAKMFRTGDVVNLGFGMPTKVMDYVPKDLDIWFDSENGIMGLGEPPAKGDENHDVINAMGFAASMRLGACCFDSAMSFALIRGGHVDYTVLGAFEVDESGNLANWTIPGKRIAGMGGAMDLVSGSRHVIAAMTHTDRDGNPKIRKKCALPLTGAGVVTQIVTELALIDVTPEGLVLREIAEDTTVDEVRRLTEAPLLIAEPLDVMEW